MTAKRVEELIGSARTIAAGAPAVCREALGTRAENLGPTARMARLEGELQRLHDKLENVQERFARIAAGEKPETVRRFRDEASAAHAAIDEAATALLIGPASQQAAA